MAEHHHGPAETGAEMDYSEHEKTYALFVNGTKYGTIICVALMVAMAAGFFTSVGLFSGMILFFLLSAGGIILSR